ncbi:MAG TPA: trimeric intracellular cation channel family protein [Pseudomonas xinjiangensis]|uniref:Trimeric intracellular cation channel family protein n=2 Tax=root TaxID=1 RepID=A0A7V1BLG2_9GAMM|nr:trimeric intracellular cation channel family protein [Halopseudomonas xinjiangensis]HEC48176.1 trimeric intracellular cation channel family protein [Halopseudomonas xinjiangensis]
MNWLYAFDLFGVAVFAITGALMAGRKSMDLFGVLVIAIITALGGGTLRDVILDNHPVSWIGNDWYILVAVVAAVGTVIWVRFTRPIHETGLLVADAFGLAVFTVIGTQVALQHDVPVSAAVIMGVMTGVAGGVMRDIVCNEIPLIFHKEIYATACIVGSLVYILLRYLDMPPNLDIAIAILTVLSIRLAAIRWHLALPRFHLLDRERPPADDQ